MSSEDQQACPVDPKAREAWVQAAKAQSSSSSTPTPDTPQTLAPNSLPSSSSCGSNKLESQNDATPTTTSFSRPKFASTRNPQLSHDRQTSSIPRFSTTGAQSDNPGQPYDRDANPNAQSENPIASGDGNWVYPSESQFYSALVRKHGAANAPPQETIPNIIPIHNAVNERTWREILDWERLKAGAIASGSHWGSEKDGSGVTETGLKPQLVSFKGDSQKLTPRARMYSWLGYQAPFDRHDWLVRRQSGEEVEYVIDFYAGKPVRSSGQSMPLSFFLDVRPKLNSVEGCRMRFSKFWGRQ